METRLRQARLATVLSLATALSTSLFMPGIGLWREERMAWVIAGAIGISVFAAAQASAVYLAVTPWLTRRVRQWLMAGFVAASVLSVFLVGPVGNDDWATWAWIGASIVGTAPLLVQRWTLALVTLATAAASAAVAWWTGGDLSDYVLITAGVGLGIAAIGWLQVWFWDLLVQAQEGREAQGRLAASEERLRFSRDVHDLLGHSLSVIALKAELAARLAEVDPARAGKESAEVQRLAASALSELREVIHGYRMINLVDQMSAVAEVLRSSGVRCTVTGPGRDVPPGSAALLAPVLREATTNVLRHSTASWCEITVGSRDGSFELSVTNDGTKDAGPDRFSFGLRGLADRIAEAGGTLRTTNAAGVFRLVATVGELS